jgi:hypothetical protein
MLGIDASVLLKSRCFVHECDPVSIREVTLRLIFMNKILALSKCSSINSKHPTGQILLETDLSQRIFVHKYESQVKTEVKSQVETFDQSNFLCYLGVGVHKNIYLSVSLTHKIEQSHWLTIQPIR